MNFNQVKGRTITAYFTTKTAPIKPAAKPILTASRSVTATNAPVRSVMTKETTPSATTATQQEQTSLERVLVDGNGQSIYYAVDDQNKMIGLNHVECSRMNIEFNESKVGRIRFYGRPDAQLIPPKEITGDDKELDGFSWREAEKPTKGQVLWLETPPEAKPGSKKPLKIRSSTKPLAKKLVPRGNK